MEYEEDFKIIKEKIIKTDQVLRMYIDMKGKYTELTNKHEQTMNDFSMLKLDNDMKSFQFVEQSKEIDQLKTSNSTLSSEYSLLKSSHDKYLNELVNLQMKYQSACKDLIGHQSLESTPPETELKKKVKKRKTVSKNDISSSDELSDDNGKHKKMNKNSTGTNAIKIEILDHGNFKEQQKTNNFQIDIKKEDLFEKFNKNFIQELNSPQGDKNIHSKSSDNEEMSMHKKCHEKEDMMKRKFKELEENFQQEQSVLNKNWEMKEIEINTKWENKLKTTISNLKEKIHREKSDLVNSFEKKISNMNTEWQEKEKKLKTEIEHLKENIQKDNSVLRDFKKKEMDMKSEWQERERRMELRIANMEEKLFLSKNNLQQTGNSLNNSLKNSVSEDLFTKSLDPHANPSFDSNSENCYEQIYLEDTTNFNELKQTNLMETCGGESSEYSENDQDIFNIMKEMRLTMISPISELPLEEDHIKKEDRTVPTEQITNIFNSTESHQQTSERRVESDWNDRYKANRKRKEKKYQKLSTIKKAKEKFWLGISRTFVGNSNLRSIRQTRRTKSRRSSMLASEIKTGSSNTLVDGIATIFADLVSQKLLNSKSRVRGKNDRNILEVNKMLLDKAKQEKESKNLYKIENLQQDVESSSDDEVTSRGNEGESIIKSYDTNHLANLPLTSPCGIPMSGMETSMSVDSCYESIISNPPSIESFVLDNMSDEKKGKKQIMLDPAIETLEGGRKNSYCSTQEQSISDNSSASTSRNLRSKPLIEKSPSKVNNSKSMKCCSKLQEVNTSNSSISPSISYNLRSKPQIEKSPTKIETPKSRKSNLDIREKRINKVKKPLIIDKISEITTLKNQEAKVSETPALTSGMINDLTISTMNQNNTLASKFDQKKINIIQDIILKSKNKSMKRTEQKLGGFKRPVRTKVIPACPQSPPLSATESTNFKEPIIIPLDKSSKLDPCKAASLFRTLITYSTEEKKVEEVARYFCNQEVDYISRLILQQIIEDKEKPDAQVARAPLMTHTQRVMLGFMLKLEKLKVPDLINTYLMVSELYLIGTDQLEAIESITRLNVAICKSHGYIERMRRFCLEALYFMGDLAVPFLFTVLTSWIEVLPPAKDSESFPLVKVMIQLINLKTCNKPGFNLLPLRDLLNKFYEYPKEPWNSDTFFKDLFTNYLKNPATPGDFTILLYCKNSDCKWVYQKIDSLIKPILESVENVNFKATLIVLIGNIMNQFHGKLHCEYIELARNYLNDMMTKEGDIPDVVKKSILYSLQQLPKTGKKVLNKRAKKEIVQSVDKPKL